MPRLESLGYKVSRWAVRLGLALSLTPRQAARYLGDASSRRLRPSKERSVAGTPPKYRVGSLELLVLSDGSFRLDAGAVFGVVPRTMWEPVVEDLDDSHRTSLGLNCLLLQSEGKTILIETGIGDKGRQAWLASPLGEGNLLSDLAAHGFRPEDVDIVINTHLHADHCGWNTRYLPIRQAGLPAGQAGQDKKLAPSFPRARYFIQRGEWEAARRPNERTRATYLAENLAPLEECSQLELIEGETPVTSEVTIIPSPGHTEHHASVVITSGGEVALYVGDIAQHRAQLERLAWVSAFDVLPLVSLETKRRLVERAIRENALVISVHLPFPGAGRMTMTPEGRHQWQPL
jgi:glyoxylase-like metal-dependent hydrolase (beta-lactamase superfamily II)